MTMTQHRPFTILSRALHWTMAAMVLAMLFIGVGMVTSLSDYHWLISIHKPLGILILVLVSIRLVNRLLNPPPPLPDGMPGWQRFAAQGSHAVLYALMFAVPLVGWAMLSAARYPVVLYGPLQLPPIAPESPELFAVLRLMHTVLALLLFATFLAHLSAALIHALIFRDDVFTSMTSFRFASDRAAGNDPQRRAEASAATLAHLGLGSNASSSVAPRQFDNSHLAEHRADLAIKNKSFSGTPII
jgi:cytochrome b561